MLEKGNVVAIPTETVYGLAANALNTDAVLRIFSIKNRPFFDPLIVHISYVEDVYKYVSLFHWKAKKLAEKFWPGPLTLILPKKPIIPDIVTSGLPYVGLRIPNHQTTLQILEKLDFPLAAPSANPFGYVSPTSAEHVAEQLGDKIPLIVDGGKCKVGIESTIVFFENDKLPSILRYGAILPNEIENCIGNVNVNISSASKPNSPGKLDKHYSTITPIKPIEVINFKKINKTKTAAIVFDKYIEQIPYENQIILSENASLSEAACNLFEAMRKLDNLKFELIIYGKIPQTGLGLAINDRLKRAGGG